MFVSDRLVFVELHKTGGTHIGRWLAELVGGEQVGKHNRVPPELRDRFVLGSVRNPWDWYVSLWAFGCGGEGGVFRQTTRRVDWSYLNRELHPSMGRRRTHLRASLEQGLRNLLFKPVRRWRRSYRDPTDPAAFREWLFLVLDPSRRFDVGEGFGFSPVSAHSGLLTYRFLKLFTDAGRALYEDPALGNLTGVRRLWQEKRIVDFVIHTENLEADLMEGLRQAGHEVTPAQRAALLGARDDRTNASKRRRTEHYYDEESIELVARRERLVIESFGYEAPRPAPARAAR